MSGAHARLAVPSCRACIYLRVVWREAGDVRVHLDARGLVRGDVLRVHNRDDGLEVVTGGGGWVGVLGPLAAVCVRCQCRWVALGGHGHGE